MREASHRGNGRPLAFGEKRMQALWLVLKRLSLGVGLIVAASAILLYSDWERRVRDPGDVPEIAILQFASRPLVDENIRGVLDGLAEAGFVDGETISIKRFNAQNDMLDEHMKKFNLQDQDWRPAKPWYKK